MELSTIWDPVIKVILAMILGGIMGMERELAQKPAGLRTHMLVAGAASFLVILGEFMVYEMVRNMLNNYGPESAFGGNIRADPIRIIQAIIVGISFLGAGTIIFNDKNTVEGLTTAASILFASAIGIGVALQQYLLATVLTILAIIILYGLGFIEKFIIRFRKRIYEGQGDP